MTQQTKSPAEQMDVRLLPCPFCGGKAAFVIGMKQTVRTVDVICQDCGGSMPAFCEEDAANDWNARAAVSAGGEPVAWRIVNKLNDHDICRSSRTAIDLELQKVANSENWTLEPLYAALPPSNPPGAEPIVFWYKNYRGEQGYRHVIPSAIRFGSSDWHKESQWLLLGFDTEKGADREFAMKDISAVVGFPTLFFCAQDGGRAT